MRNPLRRGRRGIALAGALCAAIGLVTAPAANAALPVPAVPNLHWQPCADAAGFLCATAAVPLDYARPNDATIDIAVIKHPATDPAHRVGSVFFNPGGPGGAGTDFLPLALPNFAPAVRDRFDVISFDPRGIGRSTPLQCFDTIDQEQRLLSALPSITPTGAAQQRAFENTYAEFDKACAAHAGPLLAHDTTADVARDMDLLRQAVGERTLNYFGASYGTYLGATYANLFPDKVRAMALDGNLDPVAWATGTHGSAHRLGIGLRVRADEGSAATLDQFLNLCGRATTSACAFSAGSPAATHARFDALLDRLASHPVTLGGATFTRDATVGAVVSGLYATQPLGNAFAGWSAVAGVLEDLWTRANGGPAPAGSAVRIPAATFPGLGFAPTSSVPYAGAEAALGVTCSESPNPRNPAEYGAQADFATARSGVVGPVWSWDFEACAQWPVLSADRYTGPWNRPTAPILVIGNTFDPSTNYTGSVAMARDLANARLLTVNGYGHTALLNQSRCVNTIEGDYFVTGALPAPGTVCQQDQAPFAD